MKKIKNKIASFKETGLIISVISMLISIFYYTWGEIYNLNKDHHALKEEVYANKQTIDDMNINILMMRLEDLNKKINILKNKEQLTEDEKEYLFILEIEKNKLIKMLEVNQRTQRQ